jgi:hypothetical protein
MRIDEPPALVAYENKLFHKRVTENRFHRRFFSQASRFLSIGVV